MPNIYEREREREREIWYREGGGGVKEMQIS